MIKVFIVIRWRPPGSTFNFKTLLLYLTSLYISIHEIVENIQENVPNAISVFARNITKIDIFSQKLPILSLFHEILTFLATLSFYSAEMYCKWTRAEASVSAHFEKDCNSCLQKFDLFEINRSNLCNKQ